MCFADSIQSSSSFGPFASMPSGVFPVGAGKSASLREVVCSLSIFWGMENRILKPKEPSRIVAIEDNPADVTLLRLALDSQCCPYHLEVLSDGEQALRFVREHCKPGTPEPCVLILDLHLPKYDGFAVLRAIREAPAMANLQVVIFTGAISNRERAELLAFNVRLIATKPSDVDDFLKVGADIFRICREHVSHAAA